MLLNLQDVAKSHGEKHLFSNVTFGLGERDRLALIGVNGTGKSTLLRILAGEEDPDAGSVTRRQRLRLQYVSQNPEFDDQHTLLDHLFAVDLREAALVRDYEATLRSMEDNPGLPGVQEKFSRLSHQMDAAGAWDYEARAKAVLSRLQMRDFDARVGSLSGGYRKRLGLAHALLAEPDVLILDEPTNHLDTGMIDWLESYLKRFPGAVVLVTHDRYFLDRVCTRIIEIDAGTVAEFPANFSGYLERKAELASDAAKAEDRRRNRLRNELAWLRRGARARTTKAKNRVKAVHDLADLAPSPSRQSLTFNVQTRRLGKQVLEVKDLGYAVDGRTLFDHFSHTFTPGERLGVIGPNGCGKSTLAGLITGRILLQAGALTTGETVVFGYFDQESHGLHPQERAIDFVKREGGELLPTGDGGVLTAERLMERFLFTPQMLHAPIENLSGGERRRLQLVCLLLRDPNFLILDEPTNDLDIPTLQALEDFLDAYTGCLIVISHDRYFLDRTIDRILAFEEGPTLRMFPGTYTDYAERIASKDGGAEQAGDGKRRRPLNEETGAAPVSPRRLTYKEKIEFEGLEKEIAAIESRIEELDVSLRETDGTDYVELGRLTKEQQAAQARLDAAFERWSELAEIAEG